MRITSDNISELEKRRLCGIDRTNAANEPVNILLVDDEYRNLSSLDRLLDELDSPTYRSVYKATSGKDAISLCKKIEFAIILLDVRMPKMDGYETASHIRQLEHCRHIPFIFITAYALEENFIFKGYECGAIDYITKPFNNYVLLSKVKVLLELGEYKDALVNAKKDAERSSEAKSKFLSNVSHELRTPLSSILAFSQILSADLAKGKIDNAQQYLQIIRHCGEHQQHMINDLLDLAQINSGKIELKPHTFNLVELLEQVKNLFAYKLEDNGLSYISSIDLPADCQFYADPIRLKQVLINIMSNGIKYTNEGSIELKAAYAEDDELGEVLQLAVVDTGIGIKPEAQQKLFEEYSRLHLQDYPHITGIGLGLMISKVLVELHGGHIKVNSCYGEGSEFIVTLPWDSSILGVPTSN